MSLILSVVLCTYNRSNMLRGCMESLCKQTLEKSKYEIIVVDNNSSDNTRHVVDSFLNFGNVHYLLETCPGLSRARNRGLEEAQGQYVAYIDDDARAAPDWLEVADKLIESIQPPVDCLGGPCYPFYSSPKRIWFDDKYEIRGFGDISHHLKKGEYISGSNMIWAKGSLIKIGGFNVNVGVTGKYLVLGEETDAFNRLLLMDEQSHLYYSPALIIYHWVPEFKMKVFYRLKRKFAEGQFQALQIEANSKVGKLKLVSKLLFNMLKAFIRFLYKLHSYPYWQNCAFEEGGRIAYFLGMLLGCMGINPKIIQAGK